MAMIEWATIDGTTVHISTLNPQARPNVVTCICCGEQLTPKLGNVKEWHFAHQPNSGCALTHPETALHFNKKWEWARKLKAYGRLDMPIYCERCGGNPSTVNLIELITETKVEWRIGNFVADVAIFESGILLGVVEIVVTHRMEKAKEDYFKSDYITYVEIDARDRDRIINSFPIAHTRQYKCDQCVQRQAEIDRVREQRKLQQIEEQRRINAEREKIAELYLKDKREHQNSERWHPANIDSSFKSHTLKNDMEVWHIGASVYLMQGGEIIWHKGYISADVMLRAYTNDINYVLATRRAANA